MKVLHIEDADLFADLVRRVCKDASFSVETVGTLSEAAYRLSAERFDVLVVDLHLPDSSGMDTVRELRVYGIPMIVLTADPTEDFVRQAAALGVADYVSKDNLSKVNLPLKIQFVHQRARAQVAKKPLSFQGLGAIKPYLACAVLA